MSSQALLNFVAKKALKDVAVKNINSRDPYYENVHIYDKNGRDTGRVRKQKKGIPTILSEHDGEVLKRVRKRAYHLDMSLFNCCGIRFGWSSVIGFVPAIGDLIDALLALQLVRMCDKINGGLPLMIKERMIFNVVLDFAIGLVPFLGDVADAVFRANTRNAWILEEYLLKKAEEERKLRDGTSDLPADIRSQSQLAHTQPSRSQYASPQPTRPQPAHPPASGGFLGLFGGRDRDHDVEMGVTNAGPSGGNRAPVQGNQQGQKLSRAVR